MPLISTGAALGATAIASGIGALANYGMQKDAQFFSAQEAQKQRTYEENMSNTAYQRSRADMEAAGLNPSLMMNSGQAASTPNGATGNAGLNNSDFSSNAISNIMTTALTETGMNNRADLQRALNKAINEENIDARLKIADIMNHTKNEMSERSEKNKEAIATMTNKNRWAIAKMQAARNFNSAKKVNRVFNYNVRLGRIKDD